MSDHESTIDDTQKIDFQNEDLFEITQHSVQEPTYDPAYDPYLNELSTKSPEPNSVKQMLFFSFILSASLFYLSQWGSDAFNIAYLKTISTFGLADNSDYNRLLNICVERIKPDCVESALKDKADHDGSTENYAQLGDFLRLKGRHTEAVSYYIKGVDAINATTTHTNIYYGLAKSYESLGKHDYAILWYAKAIESKTDMVQVTVTESYVRLLKSLGRDSEANAVIIKVRKIGNSKDLFSHL